MGEVARITPETHDFLAKLGIWMSASQFKHREAWNAKRMKDGDQIPKSATCAVLPHDNADWKRKHQGQAAGGGSANGTGAQKTLG